ncbi:MAG: nitroreductase family protein [Lachnospirales bacterium]
MSTECISTIKVDKDKCVGCNLCSTDCPMKIIEVKDNLARILKEDCLKCGHCLSVCPKNAITIEEYDMNEIIEGNIEKEHIDSDKLMKHLMLRRSVRQYTKIPVEREKIKKIIEAGRYTATARNRQNVRYIVIDRDINRLEDLGLKTFKKLSKLALPLSKVVKLPYDFSKMNIDRGFLFHEAPAIILVVSSSTLDAGLASTSMELMAESLGLGTLYVGLFTAPANKSKEIRKLLKIEKNEKIVSCLALGYPDVKYYRSAPKKKANIMWSK